MGLIQGSQIEPITLSEVKEHLKIDHNDEDNYLNSLIIAARQLVEKQYDIAFINQTWEEIKWGGRKEIFLNKYPVNNVQQVELLDDDGTSTITTDIIINNDLGSVRYLLGKFPTYQRVKVTYVAGYGDNTTDVPEGLKAALKMLITYLYENRGDVSTEIPKHIELLFAPYRVMKI